MTARPLRSHRLRNLLAEMGVESVGFDGRAGLGRDQEERPGRFNGLGNGADRIGEGRIKDNEFRVFRRTAEGLPQHLRPQAAAAHAQQHDMTEPGLPDAPGKSFQQRELSPHDGGDGQPVQTVADFGGVRVPNGMVTVPDAAHQIFPAQDVQLRVQAGQIRFEKWQRGHRR